MANAKRRVKAPKNKTKKKPEDFRTKKGLRSLRAVIEIELSDSAKSNEAPGVVRKRTSNTDALFLSPEEKVRLVLQNGHLLKNKSEVNTPGKTRGSRQSKLVTESEQQPTRSNSPGLIKTKSGCLKRSKHKYLKMMDEILKTELCIIPGEQTKSNCAESSKNGVNNNNDTEITNQNNKSTVQVNDTKDKHNTSDKAIDESIKPSGENTNSVPVQVSPAKTKEPAKSAKNSEKTRYSKRLSGSPEIPDAPKKIIPASINRKNSNCYRKDARKKDANGIVIDDDESEYYECDHCSKTFLRKYSLVRHIYVHIGRPSFACPVCPKRFRVRRNMKMHLDRDHCIKVVDDSSEAYTCEICDKPFLSEQSLNLHLTSHAKGENIFKCIYCDKKFAYQLLLIQHEKKHLVTGKYQCTLCDVKYNSRDKLYVHVKSHLKLTDYICQYCGREFLRANSMKRHVQTMHAGRTIQCPICNKKLKGHLTEHMRTHDKKRPHECPECGKLFAQSTQLKVHLRVHNESRPYMCRICERPFSHSNALMLHFRRHTGEKPFPCAECPMSFSQLPHMKSHMFKIHNKMNPYKCLLCSDYFKLKKDLLVHKKTCKGTGVDTDLYGDNDGDEGSPKIAPVESTMSLSRMRFLLALLLTMVASKEKLKYLGFNKRLVDDLLVESLEAMDQIPCRDMTISPLLRLKTNIEKLLKGTVPKEQMAKFKQENKSTEELLELLTSEKEK